MADRTLHPEVAAGEGKDVKSQEHGLMIDGDLVEAVVLEQKFGYQQEMPRTKTFFNMWIMTIVLSSVPYGLGTTFFYTLLNGGASVAMWDWIIMSIIYVCIATSLGEIASLYPVSGGVYYWSFMLSPPKHAPLVSWIVGWLSVIGNVVVTLSVNFATTQLILSSVNLYYPEYIPAQWHTVLCAWALILLLGSIAILGQHYLVWVDQFTLVCIVATVLATVITLPIYAASGIHSAKYVFTEFVDSGVGFPKGWSWVLGLIQGAYCFSATGMLPSMAEEAIRPEMSIPRAMVYGVMLNATLGFTFLIVIMFTLGDISTITSTITGQPLPQIFLEATGHTGAAFGLFFMILIIGLSCGLACSQAASRCVWAFSRDGGIPGHNIWGKVSKRLEMPLNAFFLNTAVQMALACIYFGSIAAFNAFLGVAVISLGSACCIPVALSFFRGREEIKAGPFYKGKIGYVCNIVTILWFIIAIPLLCFPAAVPVTPDTMNYAAVVFVGFALIAFIWYLVWGRTHYRGPPDSRTGL